MLRFLISPLHFFFSPPHTSESDSEMIVCAQIRTRTSPGGGPFPDESRIDTKRNGAITEKEGEEDMKHEKHT